MTLATTKRTVKEITSASMQLYKNGLIKALPLCALYFLILFALQLVQQFAYAQPGLSHGMRVTLTVVLPLINFIAQPIIFAAVIYTLHRFAHGEATHYKMALGYSLRRAPHLLLGYILFVLLMAIGTLLFVIPGLIAFVSFTFFYMFVLFDNSNGFRSLSGSAKLVWPHWGRTALVLLFSILIFVVLGLVAAFAISFITYLLAHFIGYLPGHLNPSVTAHNFTIVTTTLVPTLLLPLPAAFMLNQYYDLKIRQAERAEAANQDVAAP